MTDYKLLTYETASGPRAGLLVDDLVYDAATLTGSSADATVISILEDWAAARVRLCDAADRARGGAALNTVKLRAPILWPSTIYCAGANFTDHALEMARRHNRQIEEDPRTLGLAAWHIVKASRTLADPGTAVAISGYSKQLDWEIELAVVIGKRARNIPQEQALDYVAGYTIANDLSARDHSRRPNVSETSPFRIDWTRHKSFDEACPLGPWITPSQFIKDPHNLGMKLWVNDALKQDSNSSRMIFSIQEQISHLSSGITLYPGDLVLTGTPAGVGAARGEYLKAGDTMKLWIEEIGVLANTVT